MVNRHYTIVDRRNNSGDKNLTNRQRFLKRAKEELRKSVKESLQDRDITSEDDQSVYVPLDGIHEPHFHYDPDTGCNEYILTGNEDYEVGDLIDKPPMGDGSGDGDASDSGEGEDAFAFVITKDEYYNILFEDLELPNIAKRTEKDIVTFSHQRSGYSNVGTPAQLDLLNTMKKSIGRRLALKKPHLNTLRDLEHELSEIESLPTITVLEESRATELKRQITSLRHKTLTVPYIDPLDLRYRHYERKPHQMSKCVLFLIMDVSGSMGVHEKDLAKRFNLLLYVFLQRKYKNVDVVFIRHHSRAKECTEEEFFYSRETGGTIVSTGFQEMLRVQRDRYPVEDYNIYVSQVSDGDNFSTDNKLLRQLLKETILPMVQYMVYLEVGNLSNQDRFYQGMESKFGLWPIYKTLSEQSPKLETGKVSNASHVYSVFRKFFLKNTIEE